MTYTEQAIVFPTGSLTRSHATGYEVPKYPK